MYCHTSNILGHAAKYSSNYQPCYRLFRKSFYSFLFLTNLPRFKNEKKFSNKLIWDSKICKLYQVEFVSLPIVTVESEFVCQFHFPSAQARRNNSVERYKSESKSFYEIAIVRHFPTIAVMEKVLFVCFAGTLALLDGENIHWDLRLPALVSVMTVLRL